MMLSLRGVVIATACALLCEGNMMVSSSYDLGPSFDHLGNTPAPTNNSPCNLFHYSPCFNLYATVSIENVVAKEHPFELWNSNVLQSHVDSKPNQADTTATLESLDHHRPPNWRGFNPWRRSFKSCMRLEKRVLNFGRGSARCSGFRKRSFRNKRFSRGRSQTLLALSLGPQQLTISAFAGPFHAYSVPNNKSSDVNCFCFVLFLFLFCFCFCFCFVFVLFLFCFAE
jgi:hypothetical protein